MEIKNAKSSEIYRAAFRSGVNLVSLKPYRTYWHVQVAALGDHFNRQSFTATGPQLATGQNGARCLCWHGYYEFFRNLFVISPNAEVRTRLPDKSSQRYNATNFSTEAPKTGVINVSHWVIPVAYWDACACRRMIEKKESTQGQRPLKP